eukprot:Skav227073  [mRNA]  locus=scaffold4434:2922:6218:- [translate_table: standard]
MNASIHLLLSHVWHIHARHARSLRSHHLAQDGHNGFAAGCELVVGCDHEENLLQVILSLVDDLHQQLVVRLLLVNGGSEGSLVGEIFLQDSPHGLSRRLVAGKAFEHLLHYFGALGFNAETVQQSQEVLQWLHRFLLCRTQSELTLEGRNLLHLGRILQLQLGQELAGRHDASGSQGMADLARLWRLQGHNHLHGFQFHESLSLGNLSALFVQVAHHFAIDV